MKRLFACSLLILAVPIITATLQPGASSNAPFASTAFAGHTVTGGFCQCGCPGCICDPGEEIDMCFPGAKDGINATDAPARSSQSDVPAAAFFVGTGLLIWKRIRR
jgi:hypothetical protein